MKYKLKKELSLWQLVLYGVGIILGAGIYSLIGVAAGIGGNAVWMSFLGAAIVASFSGLSYAELSSMYPKSAAEYNYTRKAFGSRSFAFTIGWILALATIVSASAVALGFAGYFVYIFGGSILMVAVMLITILSIISYIGMKESSFFNSIAAIIEAGGLIFVAVIGFLFMGSVGANVDFFELPAEGFYGLGAAAALIFFAYIGFEDLANIAEEAKKAKKMIPKALIISVIVSTVLYMLVAISSVGLIGADALAASNAPLTEVVEKAIPNASLLMSIIALFATGNTVLILLIVASRILYGIANNRDLPKQFAKVGKRNTPYISIIAVMIISILALGLGDIEIVAKVATFSILLVYTLVNAALIKLRFSRPNARRDFKAPVNIGKLPVPATLGVISSIGMLFFFDSFTAIFTIAVSIAGTIFYLIAKRWF